MGSHKDYHFPLGTALLTYSTMHLLTPCSNIVTIFFKMLVVICLLTSVLALYSEIEHNGCRLFNNIPSGKNSGFKVSVNICVKEFIVINSLAILILGFMVRSFPLLTISEAVESALLSSLCD